MDKKALPTPREFQTKIKQWQMQVSYNSLVQEEITFWLRSKKQKQVQFKQSYFIENLPIQIKENYFKQVYDLYVFLERQHNRQIKIYYFYPEEKTLRFAYRIAKKVFSLKLKKFVNGIEQKEEGSTAGRQSHRYSMNPCRMSVKQVKKEQITSSIVRNLPKQTLKAQEVNRLMPISEEKQQSSQQIIQNPQNSAKVSCPSPLTIKQTAQTLHYPQVHSIQEQDAELDYFYDLQEQEESRPQLKFTQQEDIDYDSWINTIEDNGSEIMPSKVVVRQVQDYLVDEDQSNPYDMKRKIVNSYIYEEDEQGSSKIKKKQQRKSSIDFRQVVKENIQLRHERDQLAQKVTNLTLENQSLKNQLLQQQQLLIQSLLKSNPVQSSLNNSQNRLYGSNPNIVYPFPPSQPTLTQNPISFMQTPNPALSNSVLESLSTGPYSQPTQQRFSKVDEWSQQYTSTKRPCVQSEFFKHLDQANQKLNICYQQYTLKDFQNHFFPHDWSQIKVLNLDGNMLETQGFDKVIFNLWPSVIEISAGYNIIRDVRNIQNLPNLTKIDLRANPLTQTAKNYLKSIQENRKIQILYHEH